MLKAVTAKRKRVAPLLDPHGEESKELSAAQQEVLQAVAARRNVFLTGRAGCGKTRTLQALCSALTAAGTAFAITATTGIAAEVFPDATTINSFLCIYPGKSAAESIAVAKYARKRIAAVEVLIIDEISMASEEMLSTIVAVLRAMRRQLPILVLSGDFLQLGPVEGRLALGTPVWEELAMVNIVLQDSWRQASSSPFLAALDNARLGSLSDADLELFRGRVRAAPRVNGVLPTFLTPYRKAAAEVNDARMAELPGETTVFTARVELGKKRPGMSGWETFRDATPLDSTMRTPAELSSLTVLFPAHLLSSNEIKGDFIRTASKMVRDSNTEAILALKVGCQVVFTVNYDKERSIVNGTRGVVTDLTAGSVSVRTYAGLDILVTPFAFAREMGSGMALLVMQIPLAKAWALTMHKSQGMSLDNVDIDVGMGIFADGQAYVALSRARTLEGLYLRRFHAPALRSNAGVLAWYRAHAPLSQKEDSCSGDMAPSCVSMASPPGS